MTNLDEEAIQRGIRLRKLRKMADINAEVLAQLTGFSRASISYWENASNGGLSHKGAEKIIKIIQTQGIRCSLPWLLLGIGEPPTYQHDKRNENNDDHFIIPNKNLTNKCIEQEINLFKKNNENSVIFPIENNRMVPLFGLGDYVGGNWQTVKEIFLGKACIVHNKHSLEIRIIKPGSKLHKYNLSYLTYNQSDSNSTDLFDMDIEKIAPITRVWRNL